MDKSSRLSGFYDLSVDSRLAQIGDWASLSEGERATLGGAGLSIERANQMIENVVGVHALPLGIATNFLINRRLPDPYGHRRAFRRGSRQFHGQDRA